MRLDEIMVETCGILCTKMGDPRNGLILVQVYEVILEVDKTCNWDTLLPEVLPTTRDFPLAPRASNLHGNQRVREITFKILTPNSSRIYGQISLCAVKHFDMTGPCVLLSTLQYGIFRHSRGRG